MLSLTALVIIEWRTISLFRSLLKRGNELEVHFGEPHGFFHRIAELSAVKGFRSFITHTWGINLVYVGVFILWIMLLVATIVKKPELEPRKEQSNVTSISLFHINH